MEVLLVNYSNAAVVLYLANSNFSSKCQIANIAKFNSMLIIRDLQYIRIYVYMWLTTPLTV